MTGEPNYVRQLQEITASIDAEHGHADDPLFSAKYRVPIFLVASIAFFAFSQGAVIWVYISEVFPNRVRAKGQSLGSFTHWIMAALISLGFPAVARWSRPLPFVFFAAVTVVQLIVVLVAYPETKGVSLEEIQKEMSVA